MDTKFKRSIELHPQTYGKREVVNRTRVQLSRGYNHKHPNTWDKNLVYVQGYYNRMTHTSTGRSPFETCFVYFCLHLWILHICSKEE